MIKYVGPLAQAILDAGVVIDGVDSNGIVSPPSQQSLAQPIIDAWDDSESSENARVNLLARIDAAWSVDSDRTASLKLLRAVGAVLVDEINTLRQWHMSFKTEVAAASNLADLKTRVATLPNLPDRTLAQAITALKAKINAGLVD